MVIKGRRIGLGIELSEGMMILPIITESIFSHNWIRGLLSRTDFLRKMCGNIWNPNLGTFGQIHHHVNGLTY